MRAPPSRPVCVAYSIALLIASEQICEDLMVRTPLTAAVVFIMSFSVAACGGDRYQLVCGGNSLKTGKLDVLWFLDINSVKEDGSKKTASFLVVPLDPPVYRNSTIEYYVSRWKVDCVGGAMEWTDDLDHLASGADVPSAGNFDEQAAAASPVVQSFQVALCSQPIPMTNRPIYSSRASTLRMAAHIFSRNP